MNCSFYCRKCKCDRNGYAPIEVSIIINGERTILTLPRREMPEVFARKMKAKRDNEIIDFTRLMRTKINDVCTEIIKSGEPLTASAIKRYMKYGGAKSYPVSQLFSDYILLLNQRIGISISEGVVRKYTLVASLFCDFYGATKEASSITCADIQSFYVFLNSKYKRNTTSGMMTKLKTFIRYGIDAEKIKGNPFVNVKISKQKCEIAYLSEEELSIMRNTALPPRLERVRDIALFVASCGLSYSDLYQLNVCDIQSIDGKYFIKKERCKTGIEFTAPILPEGVQILRKYDFKLPIISNQKINDFLFQIQDLCGIKQHLHLHLFRKTYASRLLNNSVKMETISRCLGHQVGSKITSSYYCKAETATILDEVYSIFYISDGRIKK